MKKLLVGSATAALALSMFAGSTFAAPSDQAVCRQTFGDGLVAASEEGTRGDFMSDTLFGNEPNEENGQTVPSQSPGPFVNTGSNEPPRNDRTRGFDGGDLQELIRTTCNP